MVKMKVFQSSLTPCDPKDYPVHGILQARILEWVAFPFSRGCCQPRDPTQVSSILADSLLDEPQEKPKYTEEGSLSLLQQIFPTQESNWGLLHCRWVLYQLSYQGSPLLQYSCLENSVDSGAWWATIPEVAKSQT